MYKIFLSLIFLSILVSPVYADSSLSQYYPSLVNNIKNGDIVSVGGNNIVLGVYPTAVSNSNNILGVIDESSNIVVGIKNNYSYPVVSSGIVQVLVSNINGDIYKGNYIASSDIPGVGEKNTQNGEILGKSLSNFSYKKYLYKKDVKVNGQNKVVLVEYIPVILGITYYSNNNNFTGILISVGRDISGKNVPFFNLIMAIVVVLAGLITLIYGIGVSLKHSLLGISRNPLSKNSVQKNLLFIITSLVFIFIVTLVIGYLILIL